ncbi:rhodanese-like domain-containing protein [Natronococcus occultus]|uniref:Sulfite reductase, beta subunit (Hemoprotein) n=1 Tax=Natronococcus occultus SP4 TaxID=694430 RepID=L0K4D9_9EURY|nr:rhodanese-like domain-containing protein [Natronococcus occultus]AGB39876.1 sulfite reductase, beta subunit (hemoprotein) [Natronococcus occultus SP4]
MSTPTVVDPSWLAAHRESVTVVDVRSQRDYATLGHVPGSVNVPTETFRDPSSVAVGKLPGAETFGTALGEAGIASEDPIVAVDDANGVDAARFLLTAAVYGHEGGLYLLDGGLEAWTDEDGELSEADPDPEPTAYDATLRADAPLVDREDVETAVEGDAVVVDTRSAAEYAQSHVPGAVQLGWEDLLEDDTGRLKPNDELEALLTKKGIRRDERIVLYCNTARRLSHTYVVLRDLGYEDVAFYEGSLTDWVRAEAPEWDPVELKRQVRAYADAGGFDAMVAELGEDVLNRLKLIGLYHQKQEGYFMLRTRAPGGVLTAEQAATIGEVADEFARAPEAYGGVDQNPVFGDGYLDVTTRQDIQLHWIRIEDIDEIWSRYEDVGLETMQACGNSVRNVVACPAAGIDPNETVDVRPIVERICERFLGDHEYANLPRKFKISIAGCHENCARAQIQDLALTPAVKDGRDGFAVRVGGGLSDGPRVASELDLFVEPDRVVELVEAMADLYMDHGSYLDTAVNRLRFLVEEWGVERFRDELASHADFEFEPAGESLTTDYRNDHVGIHDQSDGRSSVGLNVPTGRMGGNEFRELAGLAAELSEGELRLTPNQNVLVPHLEDDVLETFLDSAVVDRYGPDPGPFTRGIVTCTGREFCTYGIIETKNRAIRWARELDEWAEAVGIADEHERIRVHMSGCSASCAQPQLGDVGLRGEVYRDDFDSGRAADLGLGGDLADDEFIDWLVGKVPIEDVPSVIRATVLAYDDDSGADESFAEWSRRKSDAELRTILAERPEPKPPAAGTEVS